MFSLDSLLLSDCFREVERSTLCIVVKLICYDYRCICRNIGNRIAVSCHLCLCTINGHFADRITFIRRKCNGRLAAGCDSAVLRIYGYRTVAAFNGSFNCVLFGRLRLRVFQSDLELVKLRGFSGWSGKCPYTRAVCRYHNFEFFGRIRYAGIRCSCGNRTFRNLSIAAPYELVAGGTASVSCFDKIGACLCCIRHFDHIARFNRIDKLAAACPTSIGNAKLPLLSIAVYIKQCEGLCFKCNCFASCRECERFSLSISCLLKCRDNRLVCRDIGDRVCSVRRIEAGSFCSVDSE